MDFAKIVARARAILTTPKTEWPALAAEPETPKGLYLNYIVVVAAIPALIEFIKNSIIGLSISNFSMRIPITIGLGWMIGSYLASLVQVYVVALVINALAPSFGGQKDMTQALKTVAYAWTAVWVASIATLLPWIGVLVLLAGLAYAIYLVYLGLPHTMKAPNDRLGGYTAASMAISVVIAWLLTMAISGTFLHMANRATVGTITFSDENGNKATIDADAMSAQWQAAADRTRDAERKLQEASRSGDTAAQQAAAGQALAAATGGNGKVQSLSTDQMKFFLPDALGSLKRQSIDASRNAAMGIQVTEARAHYGDDQAHDLELAVSDTGSMKGMMAMASSMAPESEHRTDHGYEKTYMDHDRLVQESWDSTDKSGQYSMVVGKRFTVKASGHADSIDQLKQAVLGVDLAKLENLKDEGVIKD